MKNMQCSCKLLTTQGKIGTNVNFAGIMMVNDLIEEEVKTKKKIATHIKMFNFNINIIESILQLIFRILAAIFEKRRGISDLLSNY